MFIADALMYSLRTAFKVYTVYKIETTFTFWLNRPHVNKQTMSRQNTFWFLLNMCVASLLDSKPLGICKSFPMTAMPPSCQMAVLFLAGLLVCSLPNQWAWPSGLPRCLLLFPDCPTVLKKFLGMSFPMFQKSNQISSKAAGSYGLLHAGRTTVSWNRMEGMKTTLNQALKVRASQLYLRLRGFLE